LYTIVISNGFCFLVLSTTFFASLCLPMANCCLENLCLAIIIFPLLHDILSKNFHFLWNSK
jgi:hypothetical protein